MNNKIKSINVALDLSLATRKENLSTKRTWIDIIYYGIAYLEAIEKEKFSKKVCLAIYEIDDALNDAMANKDNTVVLDTKTIQIVVNYAKKFKEDIQ